MKFRPQKTRNLVIPNNYDFTAYANSTIIDWAETNMVVLEHWKMGHMFIVLLLRIVFEPWHVISNNVVCATSKASDQPAHTRSLIKAFASRLNIL